MDIIRTKNNDFLVFISNIWKWQRFNLGIEIDPLSKYDGPEIIIGLGFVTLDIMWEANFFKRLLKKFLKYLKNCRLNRFLEGRK